MEAGRATISVRRNAANDVRVRQIYVSIDGNNVAELLYGQSCTVEVEAGPHWLRANNTLVWKTLECRLDAGEHAHFDVVNRSGFGSYALLSLLGTGPIYLTFQRSDG